MLKTVTARMTVLYLVLFTLLSVITFFLVQNRLSAALMKQIDQDLLAYSNEMVYYIHRHDKTSDIQRRVDREMGSKGVRDHMFLVLLSCDQEEILTSDLTDWRGIPFKFAELDSLPKNEEIFKTLKVPGREYHVRVIYEKANNGNILETGMLLDDYEEFMASYFRTYWLVFLFMLAGGGLFGYVLARRAMSGVERITAIAAHIGRDDLDARVLMTGEGREIQQLAQAFNDMLERIQGLVNELKEVTNNIAHDLRSPITRMRGLSETTVTGASDVTEYQELAGVVIEECDRLVGMINTMLDIAMTDSGVLDLAHDRIDMVNLVQTACELFQPVAEDNGIGLSFEASEDELDLYGDQPRLQRAVANLIDNAIKFTPEGGSVSISASANGNGMVRVSVSDTGRGIPPDAVPHVFERFYRVDPSRSSDGNGLGLSLAHAIVHAHNGRIELESTPGAGSVFTILLPVNDSDT